jgi:hypothetical protein
MLAFGQPSRYQRTGTCRSCHDTCLHAQWRTSGTFPIRCPHGLVSGVQMDVAIGQASGHRMPGRIWADTVTSNRHATAEGRDADRRRAIGGSIGRP